MHTSSHTGAGRPAVRVVGEEGVDLTKVVIEKLLPRLLPGPDAQAAKQQIAPNWNYTHISRDVLPMLRERGMTEEQVRQLLVDTPRRYFE
ncbi:phosphotriesterase family protein [Blastococcus xanthinilyticus]|uniref:Phosphotriesterase family protein n=1 Tax=Blastococcus xanthinilyticus TaxID=1564164 RepID=A0A5S5CYS3_9ACTN|nr:phosphotriesterase family protein [Blastococcus xanthinilyticus]